MTRIFAGGPDRLILSPGDRIAQNCCCLDCFGVQYGDFVKEEGGCSEMTCMDIFSSYCEPDQICPSETACYYQSVTGPPSYDEYYTVGPTASCTGNGGNVIDRSFTRVRLYPGTYEVKVVVWMTRRIIYPGGDTTSEYHIDNTWTLGSEEEWSDFTEGVTSLESDACERYVYRGYRKYCQDYSGYLLVEKI